MAGLLDQVLVFLPLLVLILIRDERLVPGPVFTGLAVLGFAIFVVGRFFGTGLFEGMQSLASMSADDLRRSTADSRAGAVVVVDARHARD